MYAMKVKRSRVKLWFLAQSSEIVEAEKKDLTDFMTLSYDAQVVQLQLGFGPVHLTAQATKSDKYNTVPQLLLYSAFHFNN